MPNTYFKFKQFTINQSNAAMKVGTDGVLLGAWANVHNAARILDVGTGTGLLALMTAQRNPQAIIDAVEIDEAACLQAQANVDASPWSNRINVICHSFQQFATNCEQLYDVIVSNPPYFNNSLQSPESGRSLARHAEYLPYADLIHGAQKLLQPCGSLSVVLPITEAELFINLALNNGLYCSQRVNVHSSAGKPVIRVLLEFVKQPTTLSEQTLCIDTGDRHNYTEQYKQLTKNFYLKL